jgi:hypothetical protein
MKIVGPHTLNVSDTLLQNLLENLGVLELLSNLGNNGICQLFLLSGFDLAFISDPRIKDCLRLGGQRCLLLQLEGLGLKLCGFLLGISICPCRL